MTPTQPSEQARGDGLRNIAWNLRKGPLDGDPALRETTARFLDAAADRLTHLEGRGEAQGDELKKACLGLVQAIRHMGREREVLDECWYAVDWAEAVIDGRDPGAAVIGDDPAPSLEGQHGEGRYAEQLARNPNWPVAPPATVEAGQRGSCRVCGSFLEGGDYCPRCDNAWPPATAEAEQSQGYECRTGVMGRRGIEPWPCAADAGQEGAQELDPLFRSRCENWASRCSMGMGPATPEQWEELRDLLLAAARNPATKDTGGDAA